MDRFYAFKLQISDHTAHKSDFFVGGVEQSDLPSGMDDFERKARKASTGADIEQPRLGLGAMIAGHQQGERVEKMLKHDFVGIGNGCEVDAGVPVEQEVTIALKLGELQLTQLETEPLQPFVKETIYSVTHP